jgi:hypothetical protein
VPLGDWNLESGRRERERESDRQISFRFSVCVSLCVCGEDFGAASHRVCGCGEKILGFEDGEGTKRKKY